MKIRPLFTYPHSSIEKETLMEPIIRKGTLKDLDALENLYDALNDALEQGVNHPGWKKGIYPVRDTALQGILAQALFVACLEDEILDTLILSHDPEPAYGEGLWDNAQDYEKIFVIHTFAVHPKAQQQGVGRALLRFAVEEGKCRQMRSLRLDVWEKNLPAMALYESEGFLPCGLVDLGLPYPHLKWFRLYERILTD